MISIKSIAYLVLLSIGMTNDTSFLATQLSFQRVEAAVEEKGQSLEQQFESKGLAFPPKEIFFRAFKHELKFEVWVRDSSTDTFSLFKTYDVCMSSGELGPKRKQGDRQVPEGFYEIVVFNPLSNYHLSLGINYPNKSDSILSDHADKGGDIYIHGGCATIGCIPLTDEMIKEIYLLSVYAKEQGQESIPVHIFPTRMENIDMARLIFGNSHKQKLLDFWKNLRMGYTYFQVEKRLPRIEVDKEGKYVFYESEDVSISDQGN